MSKEPTPRENNLFGYLQHEFQTFGERPLGDVDSLALACMSYFRLPDEAAAARTHEGMPVHELFCAEWFDQMTRGLWDPDGLIRLLGHVVASPRLRGLVVSDYVDDFDDRAEKQFAAMTLRLPGGDAYVSFRGTDNSLVGWKEDFNMAFETNVPSQLDAVAYLERVAPTVAGRLYVGGHSKGGNLAVYATARCSEAVLGKIERAFSHDGPGFSAETLSDESWQDRAHLVSKTVPGSSLIGMLFERQEDYAVVGSTNSGLMQHDPFSWVIEGQDFIYEEGLGRGAGFVDESLNNWVSSLSREERGAAIEAIFQVLFAGGQDSFAGIKENWQIAVPCMIDALMRFSPEERGHIGLALRRLIGAALPDVELPSFELPRVGLPELPRLLERGAKAGE